ncbi:MAG: rod shape-determining protein MreC [Gammaproteobacteria bacterium]|nr:rod shape-determining protein MreC [Gammaproteobacteria bacterium]
MVRSAITPEQMKPLFARGSYTTLRLLVFVLLSLALMTLDHRQHRLDSARAALSLLIYPVQYLVDLPFRAGTWMAERLSFRTSLLRENSALRNQILLQSAGLQKLSALENENIRLRELFQTSLRVRGEVRAAELLAVDLDPFRRQIVINKGSLHGVTPGLPLLDANGLMGQVINVGPVSSIALLITDPSHAVPVQVSRNGLRALALGTGASDRLDLPYIPTDADIQVGDMLITSGLGGRFPPDYPVAKVVSVDHGPGYPFARIRAVPTAHLEHSREVLLVLGETTPPVPLPEPEPPAAPQKARPSGDKR